MTSVFACMLTEESRFEQIRPVMLQQVPPEVASKAMNYFHANDTQRHLIGELLARYALFQSTGQRHHSPFITGEKGKPHPDGYNGTHFNVSHSGNWVAVAISDVQVGVDVERMRKVPEGVAYRFFSEPEKAMLDKASDDFEKAHIFFVLWTLKESFLKAIGKGLTKSLGTFTVLHEEDGNYCLAPDEETMGFYLKSYPFEEGYKLAVCAASPDFDHHVHIIQIENLLNISNG